MRTRTHMRTNFGGRSMYLSLIRTRGMYISYVLGSRGHFGGRSMYISYVPGAGGLSQGTGALSQGTGVLSQGTGALSQGAPTAPINIG